MAITDIWDQTKTIELYIQIDSNENMFLSFSFLL